MSSYSSAAASLSTTIGRNGENLETFRLEGTVYTVVPDEEVNDEWITPPWRYRKVMVFVRRCIQTACGGTCVEERSIG